MSWWTVVRSYRAAPQMLFRTSPTQLNLRRVSGGTIRHKDAKKNLFAKQRSKGRPLYDRLCIASEVGTRDGDGQVRDLRTGLLQQAFRTPQHVE